MTFALINAVFLFWYMLFYIGFRCSVLSYCREYRGMSKTFIRKNRKGASNYWLYTRLHREKNLGICYYINIICLVLFGIFAVGILFSWIAFLKIPIVIAGILAGAALIPAYYISLIYDNYIHFGKGFVVFGVYRVYDDKRRFASIFDWLLGIIPLPAYILLITGNVN